jgi:hypothetical protein
MPGGRGQLVLNKFWKTVCVVDRRTRRCYSKVGWNWMASQLSSFEHCLPAALGRMAAECRKRDGAGHKLFAHHQMNVSRELAGAVGVGRYEGGFGVQVRGWGPLDEMVGFGTWEAVLFLACGCRDTLCRRCFLREALRFCRHQQMGRPCRDQVFCWFQRPGRSWALRQVETEIPPRARRPGWRPSRMSSLRIVLCLSPEEG